MSSELVPGQAVATRTESDQVAGTRLPPLVGTTSMSVPVASSKR